MNTDITSRTTNATRKSITFACAQIAVALPGVVIDLISLTEFFDGASDSGGYHFNLRCRAPGRDPVTLISSGRTPVDTVSNMVNSFNLPLNVGAVMRGAPSIPA